MACLDVDWVLYCGNGLVWRLVLQVFFVCCILFDGPCKIGILSS